MRRTPLSRPVRAGLVALLCSSVLVAAGCGVAANDSAATVGGRSISASTVDDLAADQQFTAVLGAVGVPTAAGVVGGTTARQVLAFEIQRTALLEEVDRWGLQVTDQDRAQARDGLRQQFSKLSAGKLERLVDYVAAGQALEQRLAQLDPSSTKDLQLVYDGIPGQWDQVCLTAVQLPDRATVIRAAQRALDRGTALAEVPTKVKEARVVADPSQCYPKAVITEQLRTDIERARVKQVRGPIVIQGPQGGAAILYRVESVRHPSFTQARTELRQLVAQLQQQARQQAASRLWLGLVLQQGVRINPRYGSGLVPSSSGLDVQPPASPLGAVGSGAAPTSGSQSSAADGSNSSGSQSSGSQSSGSPTSP